jgi:glycosyltransferase involved in cell wall biosynthesis
LNHINKTQVSIVCPFFNEEAIIEKAIAGMRQSLLSLPHDWELICVNDGSVDLSLEIARKAATIDPRIKVVGYEKNRGRGFALKFGIHSASSPIIVTTEIDLSWGERIVHDLVSAMLANPGVDAVIASPNLPGGGYKNVSLKRVLISRIGNQIIKRAFPVTLTMNTGMTRAYKAAVIKAYSFDENGKEFHLEVLLKLSLLGHRMEEIPAVLEWKEHKLLANAQSAGKRKSSTKIRATAWRHLNFVVFANPISYLWALGLIFFITGLGFLFYGFWAFATGRVAIYGILVAGILALFSLLFFAFGVVTTQGNKILIELWRNSVSRLPKVES